jgi:hypothetical protein
MKQLLRSELEQTEKPEFVLPQKQPLQGLLLFAHVLQRELQWLLSSFLSQVQAGFQSHTRILSKAQLFVLHGFLIGYSLVPISHPIVTVVIA